MTRIKRLASVMRFAVATVTAVGMSAGHGRRDDERENDRQGCQRYAIGLFGDILDTGRSRSARDDE